MRSRNFSLVAMAIITLLAFFASPAKAVVLQFTLTDNATSTQRAFWYMDSDPATNLIFPGQTFTAYPGVGFVITDNQGPPGGFPGFTSDYIADISFFNAAEDGGLVINDFYADPPDGIDKFILDGPQLYTGPETNPHFAIGTFNYALSDDETGAGYNLLVEICPLCTTGAPVPEPSTWLTMIIGFGLVGGFMRRSIAGQTRRAYA